MEVVIYREVNTQNKCVYRRNEEIKIIGRTKRETFQETQKYDGEKMAEYTEEEMEIILDHKQIEQDLKEERKAEVNGTRKTGTIARTGR
jgi:hypothetical protein